jgi:hypothetical protein
VAGAFPIRTDLFAAKVHLIGRRPVSYWSPEYGVREEIMPKLPRMLAFAMIAAVGSVAVACSSSQGEGQAGSDGPPTSTSGAVAGTPPTPAAIVATTPTPVAQRVGATPDPIPPSKPVADDPAPFGLTYGWEETDFSKHSVPYSEIRSGGQPRDGIPPIDDPVFEPVFGGATSPSDNEPVISLEINGEAKAYPLAILIKHEIVNDELGGVPVTVTFCPLCNTAIVFDRTVNGQLLDFGTTGKLRNSDLVMWDRQTESWWQQITGEAIVGTMTGAKLKFIPAPMVSWADFKDSFTEGQVLSRDTGFDMDYGLPSYFGYDQLDNTPALFHGQIDDRLPAMERIVGLTIGDETVAYPFALLEAVPVVYDTVGGQDIAVFYAGDTLSVFAAFDPEVPWTNRQVGSTGVFDSHLDGQMLTFRVEDNRVVDDQTGSTWNILGQAVEGPLVGRKLDQVLHTNHFWFAWQAFNPDTEVRSE